MHSPLPAVHMLGMPLAKVTELGLVDFVFAELSAGRGGWLITANLDHLRRYSREPALRTTYADANLIVADGMPLVWASKVLGDALPERVAGSALIYSFAERAAKEGRSLYLLGGAEGAARAAAEVLCRTYPGLRIAGWSAPTVGLHASEAEVRRVADDVGKTAPDLLLVGLGSPKQEHLIAALRTSFPKTWMVGVGISFSFVAGHVARAPAFIRRSGLEWVHRLVQEPKRLASRYLVHDLPFAFELFARMAAARLTDKT